MILVFIVDIVTKWAVQNTLQVGEVIPVIPNFVSITLSHNMGASFGMLSEGTIGQRILWISISVIFSVVLTVVYIKSFKKNGKLYRIGLALMIAGAISNAIDRIFYWEALVGFDGVIDWISFSFFPPIFNIADSSLVIGAIILLVIMIIEAVQDAIEKNKRGEFTKSPKELEKEQEELEKKSEEIVNEKEE